MKWIQSVKELKVQQRKVRGITTVKAVSRSKTAKLLKVTPTGLRADAQLLSLTNSSLAVSSSSQSTIHDLICVRSNHYTGEKQAGPRAKPGMCAASK